MLLRQITDSSLAQNAYLIGCQRTGEALLIDPERDVDRYLAIARDEELKITAVTETHIHADFLSGTRELAEATGAAVYLSGEGGEDWSYGWTVPGGVRWLRHGDLLQVGGITVQALHTPGHTPEHLSFLVTDRGGGANEPIGIATGDFVFVGDLGRPDLLESAAGIAGQRDPSARALFRSLDRFLELPDFVQVWPGHGAGSACGKALGAIPSSTVGYEKRLNAALDAARRGEEAFVASILAGQPEPPLYFARMKRLNRDGPPILGGLPEPARLAGEGLTAALDTPRTVVVDTRLDRPGFMAAHLEGSIYAPLNRSFPTIVGSYVEPDREILLVVPEANVEDAVRSLVRIGFDRLRGWVPPSVLTEPVLAGRLRRTPVIEFLEVDESLQQGAVALDVRGAAEFDAGHVPGASNVAHTRLAARLDELPGGKLLVYCRTGARAASAVSFLESSGRDAVLVDDRLAGYLEAFEAA